MSFGTGICRGFVLDRIVHDDDCPSKLRAALIFGIAQNVVIPLYRQCESASVYKPWIAGSSQKPSRLNSILRSIATFTSMPDACSARTEHVRPRIFLRSFCSFAIAFNF